MKVILANDVDNLGRKGDVVTVADGFASQLPGAQRLGAVRQQGRTPPGRADAARA